MEIDQPIDQPWRLISISDDHFTIVDDFNFDRLSKFHWTLVRHNRCYYAKTPMKRFGTTIWVSMHKMVANTPKSMCTHHRNRNTLDNRQKNLLNMTRLAHRQLHQNNTLLIKTADIGPNPVDLSNFY